MSAQQPALPFRIERSPGTGELILWMTFGDPARQQMRRQVIPDLVALTRLISVHSHESHIQALLAQSLIASAIEHLGADPDRLRTAVRAAGDPACSVPLEQILYGNPPPQRLTAISLLAVRSAADREEQTCESPGSLVRW